MHDNWGDGAVTYLSEDFLPELAELLKTTKIAALFCETPNNALSRTPDVRELRRLADEHGFLVIVDDTVGGFVDVDLLPYVDVTCTSLTKLFSGVANVLGGR